MQKPFNSILMPRDEQERLDSHHPVRYVRTRNNLLNNMIDEINMKANLNPGDLHRNVHVEYLTRAYDRMKQKVVMAEKEKKRYLDPSQFETILETKASKEQEEERVERMRREREGNLLYEKYIENYVEEEEEMDKPEVEILPGSIEVAVSDEDRRMILLRQREMQLLDSEIDALKLDLEENERREQKRDQNPIHNCTNMSLIQKISGSIISSYMVNFDELFGLLIDDILDEEVRYLNSLQNNWKQSNQPQSQTRPASTLRPDQQTILSLIQSLDQLADI